MFDFGKQRLGFAPAKQGKRAADAKPSQKARTAKTQSKKGEKEKKEEVAQIFSDVHLVGVRPS